MYICMYLYVLIHVCIICIYSMYVCMHVCMYACVNVLSMARIYIFTYICIRPLGFLWSSVSLPGFYTSPKTTLFSRGWAGSASEMS